MIEAGSVQEDAGAGASFVVGSPIAEEPQPDEAIVETNAAMVEAGEEMHAASSKAREEPQLSESMSSWLNTKKKSL